ncbi:MAG: tetratricopeptide repeat protein [Alphaproteobacteria bacterium]|nr:tetratricopeptide repeat protein [Alphaproteobacteria bacterium]
MAEARRLAGAGRNGEALAACDRALTDRPDDPDLLNLAAAAAWGMGDAGRALPYLDRAMAAHPGHADAYVTLGVILETYGRLDEAANAYRAALEADGERVTAYLNLGNVLMRQGAAGQAIPVYDQALAREPLNVDALNNKGLALKETGRLDEAERLLRQAVGAQPGYAPAWTNLGLVLRLAKRPDEALAAYERALALDPSSIKALNNLAVLKRWRGELEEAEALCRGILETHPDVVETLNNLGDILQAQGRVDEAEALFRRVLELAPDHAEGHHNLAVLLLLKGDLKAGWAHYEWRWLAKDFPSERRNFPKPLWRGEDLAGRTILLYVEQGLGDAVQFVRYAPRVAARGGRVIVECPPVLKRLFETLDGVAQVIARGDALPAFDVQCPFLSLPGILSPDLASIPAATPYVHPDPSDGKTWRERLSGVSGKKVGLAWAGSPHHTNDRERSVPLSRLEPLSRVPGCTLFSLQIGESARQLADIDFPVADLTGDIGDYADTAAFIDQLDLVVTVDTSVAHVAGALGRPTWVMLPHAPDWRWMLDRDDTPWYPNMRLYRQESRRDWDGVLARLTADLERFCND